MIYNIKAEINRRQRNRKTTAVGIYGANGQPYVKPTPKPEMKTSEKPLDVRGANGTIYKRAKPFVPKVVVDPKVEKIDFSTAVVNGAIPIKGPTGYTTTPKVVKKPVVAAPAPVVKKPEVKKEIPYGIKEKSEEKK